jgi:3-oxoadipate enol-lactonase
VGKGVPLVFISGWGGTIKNFEFQIPYFQQKMTIIALDNRGSGGSSRPNYPYTMDMFVEDIKNLLDYLGIQEKIHLCGVSMGGMIAQHFALSYPEMVKTLILCATSAYAKVETQFLLNLRKKAQTIDLESEFKNLLPLLFTKNYIKILKNDRKLKEQIKNIFMSEVASLQDRINQGEAIINTHDTRNELNQIKQPTLISVGSKDYFLTHSKFLHEGIKNSKLEIIEGFGHGFFIEAADLFNNVIWNFIKEYLE